MNGNPTSGSTSAAYLLVTGGVASRVVALPPGSFIVGRSSDADLELSHVEISRHHCRFSWDGEHCAIEDMGSTRGTRVNGALIYGKTPLKPGDEVAIGPAILEFGVGEPPEFDPAATETRSPQGMLVHGEPAYWPSIDHRGPHVVALQEGIVWAVWDDGTWERLINFKPGEVEEFVTEGMWCETDRNLFLARAGE